jgi:hypothetical protein
MSRFGTAFARHRHNRALLRRERALQRAVASAPTVESAHELAALFTRH